MSNTPPKSTPEKPVDANWPPGVKGISFKELSLLGVDEANRLHWDGKPVITESRLGLTGGQTVGAVVTVVSAVLGGVYALTQIIDWFQD